MKSVIKTITNAFSQDSHYILLCRLPISSYRISIEMYTSLRFTIIIFTVSSSSSRTSFSKKCHFLKVYGYEENRLILPPWLMLVHQKFCPSLLLPAVKRQTTLQYNDKSYNCTVSLEVSWTPPWDYRSQSANATSRHQTAISNLDWTGKLLLSLLT